ncbi:bifunctional hydroxymethylpyrimidine kinase/phosphomethylpyrimidine kinase [Atopomonas sediminilitoris]|uniref:bifunctional hydroxymethylpyrimidine kinase/phosphomethylpyrimidine kinase n=1 Tax=Atopomonas sediminilitoris TaxID=2919919 RepID=UPI001F4DF5C5|nr:hydroxymethylpyrimidine/phosphomethylpyrimidine kinase [Atopomonas sediminilitoris]MCJ8169825.1 hydroxymethylpyrimidine/phosphomethylpyrimidine kinase [Atopomonas sediminilitoris]
MSTNHPNQHPQPCPHRAHVLCLSGHDPSGGAGIQADIEALASIGCHALPVITALTCQDTHNVAAVSPQDPDWVERCVRTLAADMPIHAIKLGMLGSAAMAERVARLAAELQQPLIIDPVLRAGGGSALSDDALLLVLRQSLLPAAHVITPNLPEAQRLAGLDSHASADQCAKVLLQLTPAVLITGAHDQTDAVINRLYQRDGSQQQWSCTRLPGDYHGSGCTLAAHLAGLLAQGIALPVACEQALQLTWHSLLNADQAGRGQWLPRRIRPEQSAC